MASAGTPLQARGGEMSAPWHAYFAGMGSPSANADDVNDSRASDGLGLVIGLTSGDGEPAAGVGVEG